MYIVNVLNINLVALCHLHIYIIIIFSYLVNY